MDRGRWNAGWLVLALPTRVLLDVAHTLDPTAARLASGLLGLSFVACAGLVAPRLRDHPLRAPIVAFAILVLIGAARTVVDPIETARLALLYLSPVAYGLAVSAALGAPERQDRLLRATAWAALVPIVLTALAWLNSGPDVVLHGYARLIGPYTSHHNLAVAMGAFVVLGAHLALDRRPEGAIAILAAPLLWLTYVRTVQLLVVIALLGMLILRGHHRVALALLAVALAAAILDPTLRDRFADVWAVLTLEPPEQGWGAVGSWRFRIWADSWRNFVDQGPFAWLFGLGLGGHRALHKALDPHNEYLALWYQLGVAGPAAFLWILGGALRDAARASAREGLAVGALAGGMIVAVLLTSAISNDFLPRPLLATFVWGAVGLVYAATRERAITPSWAGEDGGVDRGASRRSG